MTDQEVLLAGWPHFHARDTDRFGVFARPDPVTCQAQITLHDLLRKQFGLRAAAAFPPHATLLGNIGVTAGEDDLLQRIEDVCKAFKPITVHNRGLAPSGGALSYDIHYRADGSENEELIGLAERVESSLEPVRGRTDTDYLTGQMTARTFHAHLTVAGQDLMLRPDLRDEVWEFVQAVLPETPREFTVDTVSVFRFRSDHWPSEWWKDMTWQHLRSFRLG